MPSALSILYHICGAQLSVSTEGRAEGGRPAAMEATMERGVLLFKLLGNLHAPSDDIPNVRTLGFPFGMDLNPRSGPLKGPCSDSNTLRSCRRSDCLSQCEPAGVRA